MSAIAEAGELLHDPTFVSKGGKTLAEVAPICGVSAIWRSARRAPEIEGRDVDGNLFKLSDYCGRVVL